MARGDHTIRPIPPDGGNRGTGFGDVIKALFGIFLIVQLIRACVQFFDIPDYPTSPQTKAAVFRSAEAAPGLEALVLALGGGSYDVSYEAVDSIEAIKSVYAASSIFTANFKTNSTSGDLDRADTIILIGKIRVDIHHIDDKDSFAGKILSHGEKVTAYFKYAGSPRGPPSTSQSHDNKRKRIIVIGEIASIKTPDGHGNSSTDISVLELDPSKADYDRYEAAKAEYERWRNGGTGSGGCSGRRC